MEQVAPTPIGTRALGGSQPAPPRTWGLRARLVAAILRRAVRLFFRDVEIVGAEKIPRGVPLVLVANHVNAVIDPLLVGLLRLRARFLAKSTLWEHPVIRPLLDLTGAIPVHRRQDEGADPRKNAESFAACHQALARGEVIALFPEGKSHSEAGLARLKTGAARIVLEAEARHGDLGVRVVPIGLTFDAKGSFRSRALVRVGDPIDPAGERRLHRIDERAAVRRLTERIAAGLAATTLNYRSWEEARLLERAADLYAAAPAGGSLEERFATRHAFATGYRALAARQPERLKQLAESVARYDSLLRALRLRDDHLSPRALRVARHSLWRSVPLLIAWLPLALVGTVVSWPPYRIVDALANRLGREDDVLATYKLFGGIVVFPIWWLLCALAAAPLGGLALAVCAAPAAAALGWIALVFHERRERFREEARAYALLRSRRALAQELERQRNAIVSELCDLAAARGTRPATPAGDPW